MPERIPNGVAKLVVFRAIASADHFTPSTGKTIAITISKNGATSFSNPNAGATNATEMASGFYKFTLDTTDTGTNGPLSWRGAGTGIDDVGDVYEVVNATNAGFTALPATACTTNGSLITSGTGTAQLSVSSGLVTLAGVTHTGAVIPTVTTLTNLPAITSNWLTAAGIASDAITSAKIADSAITAAKIASNAITSAKFGTGAIDSAAIGTGAITASAFADNCITAAKIANGAITSATFAAAAIDASAIATDAIGSAEISAAAVTKIQSGLATPTNITAGTITAVAQERGRYAMGAVWIGPTANTNTVSYTDGIITNPVSTVAAAKTIADALNMRRFEVIRTASASIAASLAGYRMSGVGWTLTTSGSQDVGTTAFIGANVTGGTYASTTGTINWDMCEFSDGVTVGVSNMVECRFQGGMTLSTAGNYDFVDCTSVVAGTSTPTFTVPSGTVNASFRRWSGGITVSGITSGTTVSIDVVSGGTVTLNGANGNVQVRGMCAGITDNRTGSPTLGQNALINITKINAEVVDALNVDTYAEPGQTNPPATTTLVNKLGYLYKQWRNKKDQSGSTHQLYADNGTTVDQKATVSEAGGTVTKDEYVAGP